MAYLIGVLVIAVGVVASIALHEIGHLVPAKRFGVKCTQYMVGFGPTLWSKKVGETEYGFKAIPLGGYVRMLGMFPPRRESDGRTVVREGSTGPFNQLIEQARDEAQREVGQEDRSRLFYTRSVPKRLVIMLGGPTMNLLIAVVLITIVVTGFGTSQSTTRLASVSQCLLPVGAPADATCGEGSTPAPAAAAGLKPGDVVVSYDGRPVSDWVQLQTAIRGSSAEQVTIGVERDGQVRDVQVTPVLDNRQKLDADGLAVLKPDGTPELERVGFLGVSPTPELVRQPLSTVPEVVGTSLWATAKVVLTIPQKMVGVAKAAFGGAERDPNGPVSLVGVGRFAGEVASDDGAGLGSVVARLLLILASLNLALFVFNLVPLLPLDGGHAAGALWEGARRQFARLRSAPDPGPVDVARALPLAYGVASLLLGMSVLLIYADIVRPIRLG